MKHKNILEILENQIDKIVLAVYVLIALVLLWVYVIGNPYGQAISVRGREKKVSPSQIDRFVKQELDEAVPKMDKRPGPTPPVPPIYSEYDQLVTCSVSGVSSSAQIPMPGEGQIVIEDDRFYALPVIPSLTEVNAEPLRGAAKIPTDEVAPDQPYESAPHEIGDLDLVSVSARFDVRKLVANFQQSFMGPRLKTSWKDPALAEPVFARMELQRRSKQPDGSWGQWEAISRTQVDPYQNLLEELPMKLEQARYGVDVWMSQFKEDKVQTDILQPDSYQFTISRLEWMAPDFLQEAAAILDKEEEKERREALEEKQKKKTTQKGNRRPTSERRPSRERREQPRGGYDEMMGMDSPLTARRTTQKERTVDDVKKDFEKERLGEEFKIASLQDPLLVWTHDDSIEPGSVYQYRVRMGVFNPIAGKNWFIQQQAEYQNQLVLWSEFSEPTEILEIPHRIYMFPMEVIADKEASSGTEGIQVQVAKYHLGRWRNFDFDVYPGQIIGHEAEDDDGGRLRQQDEYQPMMTGKGENENIVDFTTGNIFVDILKEITLSSRLRPSETRTLLYSDPRNQMQRVPVGKRNWDAGIRKQYAMIQESMDQSIEQRGRGEMMGDEMMMDEMMMMEEMMLN